MRNQGSCTFSHEPLSGDDNFTVTATGLTPNASYSLSFGMKKKSQFSGYMTDAAGEITIPIAISGYAAGDVYTVSFTRKGSPGASCSASIA